MGFLDPFFEPVAHWFGLGTELGERLVEPQNLSGKSFKIRSLAREIAPADANERPQDQSEKKADQPRDLADHGFRLARLVLIDELRLQSEAGIAGDHEQNEDQNADKKNAQLISPARNSARWRPNRPVAEFQANRQGGRGGLEARIDAKY
jgi:hypothetical protein